MKILSNDGQEFNTVEECLKYENEQKREKYRLYNGVDIKFFHVRLHKENSQDTLKVLVVHSKSNHEMIANYIMTQLYGNSVGVSNGVSSSDFYLKWSLREMNEDERLDFGKEAVETNSALIFETSDVEHVFDYHIPAKYLSSVSPLDDLVTKGEKLFNDFYSSLKDTESPSDTSKESSSKSKESSDSSEKEDTISLEDFILRELYDQHCRRMHSRFSAGGHAFWDN